MNLGSGPSVQPLVLPPSGLGELEDRLNQDVEFELLSGYSIPEVYRAREIYNAAVLESDDVLRLLGDRRLYVQRISQARSSAGPISTTKFASEIRSMARRAKEAHDERGMNPLFLCLGALRWPLKDRSGALASAPLILVPVKIAVRRGGGFVLSLDTSAQTTPNAALIEWLRREYDLVIPSLSEPAADRAGIDVDAVLADVRNAIAARGLALDVASTASLALLDLAAFRMWQDLNIHGDAFLRHPLVDHLVHTPTEAFADAAVMASVDADTDSQLDALITPIPADATQKRAVVWAREGRSFVLQGPPGTGKSQTITNMIAECLLAGRKVLFVAEKGTALSVVQRRLDAVGLGPFTLNLHHDGSTATQVRAQLKAALTTRVAPDPAAMESAQRKLRNARYELGEFPEKLHRRNAAGLSAYSARDNLLVLGDGPAVEVPRDLIAARAELVGEVRDALTRLQPLAGAAAHESVIRGGWPAAHRRRARRGKGVLCRTHGCRSSAVGQDHYRAAPRPARRHQRTCTVRTAGRTVEPRPAERRRTPRRPRDALVGRNLDCHRRCRERRARMAPLAARLRTRRARDRPPGCRRGAPAGEGVEHLRALEATGGCRATASAVRARSGRTDSGRR
nr:DUF4011 domain-containing protein [Microbacterium chocolatum]